MLEDEKEGILEHESDEENEEVVENAMKGALGDVKDVALEQEKE